MQIRRREGGMLMLDRLALLADSVSHVVYNALRRGEVAVGEMRDDNAYSIHLQVAWR